MPGIGNVDAITPGRKTRLRFNAFLPTIIDPYFESTKLAKDFGGGSESKLVNVHVVEGIGLQLESVTTRQGLLFESPPSAVATKVYDNTNGSMGSMIAMKSFSKSSAGVACAPYMQKDVASGGSVGTSSELTADRTAFPGPDNSVTGEYMERIYVSNDLIDPNVPHFFYFFAPGSAATRRTTIAQFYFNGPSSKDNILKGFGNYALRLYGDGTAELHEFGTIQPFESEIRGWVVRATFRFASEVVSNHFYSIVVRTNCFKNAAGWFKGSQISFECEGAPNLLTSVVASVVDSKQKGLSTGLVSKQSFRYAAPSPNVYAIAPLQVRIDMRKDMRAGVGALQPKYKTSGSLFDATIWFPGYPSNVAGSPKFRLFIDADRPPGTTLATHFYWVDDDGVPTEITGTVTVDDERGLVVEFPTPAGRPRAYRWKVDLASDGRFTPTVTRAFLYRDAYIRQEAYPQYTVPASDLPTEGIVLPASFITAVDISGPGETLGDESAIIKFWDMTGENLGNRDRTGTPVDIEMINEADGSVVSVLHHGIIRRNQSTFEKPSATDANDYPNADCYSCQVVTQGWWKMMEEQIVVGTLSLQDDEAGEPMKCTDAARAILNAGGVPSNRMDIPDHPVRLYNSPAMVTNQLEIGTRIADGVEVILREYFTGNLWFDRNAGVDADHLGMIRYRFRPKPPYRHLMKFHRSHPGDMRLAHKLNSWESETESSGQIVTPNYIASIDGAREDRWWEPPEGNQVILQGATSTDKISYEPFLIQQTVTNFASANFFQLAPGHDHYPVVDSPDFLGRMVPIYVQCNGISDADGANWLARRVFDVACFAREYLSFMAPLRLVSDSSDAFQQRPRPLRRGDAVLVEAHDGSFQTWLVVRCSPSYTDDKFQWARHDLVRATNIEEFGLAVGGWDLYAIEKRRYGKAMSAMGKHPRTSMLFESNKRTIIGGGELLTLPSLRIPHIQDIDPESATFGQFNAMADYE